MGASLDYWPYYSFVSQLKFSSVQQVEMLKQFLVDLGDRKSNTCDSRPDKNKCQKRYVYPLVSVFLSAVGIFIGLSLLTIFLSIAHKSSSLECRFCEFI